MVCCVVTSTGTVKIVESCGKYEKIAKPGLSCMIPCVQNVSGTISMRLQQMEVTCETKSKDNVFLTLKVSVQYQVIDEPEKIQASHYRLTNPRVQVRVMGHADWTGAQPLATSTTSLCPIVPPRLCRPLTLRSAPLSSPLSQIESYVFDVVRSSVPKIDLDDVFTTKEQIANSITESLQDAMAGFGYQIINTPITDIEPDRAVKQAMNEINKTKRLRVWRPRTRRGDQDPCCQGGGGGG